MGWSTVYVRGKSGFAAEVLARLNSSDFPFMPGTSTERGLMLYWVPEQKNLRSFKKAIGSKTIFKHRLRFYNNVEALIESKHNEGLNTSVQAEQEI